MINVQRLKRRLIEAVDAELREAAAPLRRAAAAVKTAKGAAGALDTIDGVLHELFGEEEATESSYVETTGEVVSESK